MTSRIKAAVWAGAVLVGVAMWPSLASAQCTSASPDQTCSNFATIAGPLQAQGSVGADGGAGAPGNAGGNAFTINGGTISALGASALGGAGGVGGDGATGGVGGNGGSARVTNTGGIAGALTSTGGSGGVGGFGFGGLGSGARGGTGGNAVASNSGNIGASVTVTGGAGGNGNSPVDNSNTGSGGLGGDAGSATFTNTGSVAGNVVVQGGAGGIGGSTDDSGGQGGYGGDGGSATLVNSGSILGAATVTGRRGGGGGYGAESGGGGGAGGNATLINSGTIGAAATVTGGNGSFGGDVNDGTGGSGGNGGNATLTNSGSIASSVLVMGGNGGGGRAGSGDDSGWGGNGGTATLVNSSSIGGAAVVAGGDGGISGNNSDGGSDTPQGGNGGDATLTNTGKIAGAVAVTGGKGGADGGWGIGGNGGNATVDNWGRMLGGVTVAGGIAGAGGTDGTATLNVHAGSQIVGAITLTGSAKYLNFFGGNYSYTLNSLSGVAINVNGAPSVVIGNTVVVVDPQASAATSSANIRALLDFSRSASDAVPVFSGAAPGGAAPLAFAGAEAPSRFDDAFAAVSGLASAYAGDAVVFKAPTASYADGTTVWARGFAGQRVQQQDGLQFRNTNLFYGGMMGTDFVARPDLRTGLYLGGGNTRSAIDNLGSSQADLVFGGAYARFDIGSSFLHAAVQAGGSRNTVNRTINNNLAVNGLETAIGSFNGWYVSPEATFGHRWALGQLAGASYTLTPSLRLRYLYGAYGGYAETGTAAPLTVGSQSVSALEERGEMKLTRSVSFTPSDMLSASISAGLLGTQRMGGTTVNAALLGQAIPFATAGQTDIWGGFGGLGLEWRSRNVTLFSAAEYLTLSDRSNVASGRAGLRVAF